MRWSRKSEPQGCQLDQALKRQDLGIHAWGGRGMKRTSEGKRRLLRLISQVHLHNTETNSKECKCEEMDVYEEKKGNGSAQCSVTT